MICRAAPAPIPIEGLHVQIRLNLCGARLTCAPARPPPSPSVSPLLGGCARSSAQTVLLVLWSNAELEELDLVLGERTSPRRASLLSHPPRRCHARAQAMVFDHAHSTLVIVGQGRAAGKSQHGSGGLEAGGAGAPSVSWWRMNELSSEMVLQGHTPHSGRAGALGRLKGLVRTQLHPRQCAETGLFCSSWTWEGIMRMCSCLWRRV